MSTRHPASDVCVSVGRAGQADRKEVRAGTSHGIARIGAMPDPAPSPSRLLLHLYPFVVSCPVHFCRACQCTGLGWFGQTSAPASLIPPTPLCLASPLPLPLPNINNSSNSSNSNSNNGNNGLPHPHLSLHLPPGQPCLPSVAYRSCLAACPHCTAQLINQHSTTQRWAPAIPQPCAHHARYNQRQQRPQAQPPTGTRVAPSLPG